MSRIPKKLWRDDGELFHLAKRELFTAVVGDIMDKMGHLQQFLPPQIGPLSKDMVLIGRAMTVLEEDLPSRNRHAKRRVLKPFGLMLEALDDLKPHEIYVCSGANGAYAMWGELMTTRAMTLGAAGAVLCGYTRDTRSICRMKFPTFCFGSYAQDQAPRGQVVDYRITLNMEGVLVRPGDILFGDRDGVCVVPRAIEREVFARALEKARSEKLVKRAIQGGMSAKAAFEKYGVL